MEDIMCPLSFNNHEDGERNCLGYKCEWWSRGPFGNGCALRVIAEVLDRQMDADSSAVRTLVLR